MSHKNVSYTYVVWPRNHGLDWLGPNQTN